MPTNIALLLAFSVAGADASGFNDAKARRVCERVVRWVNNGTIGRRFVEMRTPSDSEVAAWKAGTPDSSMQYMMYAATARIGRVDRTFGVVSSGGTCSWPTLVEIPGGRRAGDAWSSDDDLRWATWGHGEHLMIVDGEPFAVSGTFDGADSEATLLSWIAADGLVQPICSLERDGREVLERVQAADRRLCRAVADGSTAFLEWDAIKVQREQFEPVTTFGVRVDTVRTLSLDLDDDGAEDQVLLVDYASGHGCGSDHQWLVAAGPSGEIDPASRINSILLGRQWGPIKGRYVDDRQGSARFLKHRGRTYLMASGENASMDVVSFAGEKARTWCSFRIHPVHRVKRYYPVLGPG
jgi:hypothetical protein